MQWTHSYSHSVSRKSRTLNCGSSVIVMTFWYVFWNGLRFFKLFKLYFHWGLITTPHVFYVHMTCVNSFSYVSFFTRSHGQEKSLLYYDLLYDFRSSTLWTHPHPHFLLPPPQPHHPYTPCLCRSTTVPPGEGHHPVAKCGQWEDPANILEDSLHSRLGTAKVKQVLPSMRSARQDGPCCREPSPD